MDFHALIYISMVKKSVANIKYLVLLCEEFDDDGSMLNCIRGIFTRGNVIKRKFSQCNRDVKVKLFQSYCTNFYCCSLWNVHTAQTYKKVKTSHNKVFRYICNCNRQNSISRQFVSFNVPNCDVIRRKSIFSLYKRILSSTNTLIVTILASDSFVTSSLFTYWMNILYL
jgi:hypothetical protein